MRFQTIVAIPLFFAGAFAAPTGGELLAERAVGQTEAAEKLCILGKCVNIGKAGPKCNIDQCFASQTGTITACAQAVKKPNFFNDAYCAAGIVQLGFNMPQSCKDCAGKLATMKIN